MKKMASVLLSMAILLLAVPMAPVHATSDDTKVINVHGSKTYLGTYSDWSDNTWDSSDFEDVTGDDINVSEDLIIKGGKVGDVTVSDNSNLTIYNGSMSDVDCDGDITMSGGTADSLTSGEDDISISGGVIKGNVDSEEGNVNLSGKVSIGGDLTARSISAYASSSGYTTVTGTASFSDSMLLEGSKYQFKKIDGQSSGTLQFKNYSGTLPAISDLPDVYVCSGSTVSTSGSVNINTLTLEDNAIFFSTNTLEIGTVKGPGALVFNTGKLTVDTAVSDSPIFDFNGTASVGATAFQAKSGAVNTGDPVTFGYNLTKGPGDSGNDAFTLQAQTGDGVTMGSSSQGFVSGQNSVVNASVNPSLNQLADGSTISWVLIDPSNQFTITPDASTNSCRIYLSGTSISGKATLGAILKDSSGGILTQYKSGLCVLNASGSSSGAPASSYDISLDTSTVSLPVGLTYSVLAMTNAPAPPAQSTYNSAVAVVGKATYYSSNGKTGWLYPVTATGKGGVTIDIGGRKMVVTVPSGSIVVDTSSYTLAPGQTYTIGVRLNGVDKNSLNIHSANNCTTVQDKGKASNGVELYNIHANQEGTGYVIFDTSAGASVKTQINVVSGAVPHGVGAKLSAPA